MAISRNGNHHQWQSPEISISRNCNLHNLQSMKNLQSLQSPNWQYTERQSPRMTISRRTAELAISRVGNLHKLQTPDLTISKNGNPQKWKLESLLALSSTKILIANEKHEERFIHTLAPFAARAMVCINLSSRVSMTIPLTSKSPPKLCPGGGLLASSWDIKVVKMQNQHVTCRLCVVPVTVPIPVST